MPRKLGALWVYGPHALDRSGIIHRKRDYSKRGGRTLCGIHVGAGWKHTEAPYCWHKCKRCAA